jgi:hypothetical protein
MRVDSVRTKLERLPKLHTSIIAGKAVTRWGELYEIGTWAKVENLIDIEEAILRLEKCGNV